MKVFLVLETEQTGATITISDLMSTSQYLVLQLQSSTTINFDGKKCVGGMTPPSPVFMGPTMSDLSSILH